MLANLEMTSDDDFPPPLSPRMAHLFVVLECDRPTAGGARYSLLGIDEVIVGRGSERCVSREVSGRIRRLRLEMPGSSLSSEHARLIRQGMQWFVVDAGSRSGSFLNGSRVERAAIRDGDLLDIGNKMLLVRLAVPTPVDAPSDLDCGEITGELPPTLLPFRAREVAELAKLTRSRLPIVLAGETGTGKEVFARAIHAASKRAGRFVAVNCGALSANLVESQLFGHVRGAFSGAVRDESGFVRDAHGGTLLLDEVGDLQKGAQATLLRVLQEGEVVPVGSARPIRVDVRIVAATQDPLEALSHSGHFRSDLRARLEGFVSHLPNLRDRREDLGTLIAALWKKLGPADAARLQFRPEAGRALCMYDWPLNVRELEQCLARALLLADGKPISCRDLPPQVALSLHRPMASTVSPMWRDDAVLRKELLAKLEKHGGNVAHVARAMGRARMQIHRWMERLSIDPNEFRRARRATTHPDQVQ